MKTIIKGKILTHKFTLDDGIETVTNADGVEERKYVRRPKFNVETETKYEQIGEVVETCSNIIKIDPFASFYGETFKNTIKLDEDESVAIEDEYYQHDIEANVIIVDHAIEEQEEYIVGTEDELYHHLHMYTVQLVNEKNIC